MPRARLLCLNLVAAALMCGTFLASCGGDDEPSASKTSSDQAALAPNIVTEAKISSQPAGSPQRSLLQWWQAIQFGDSENAVELTAASTKSDFGQARLRKLIDRAGAGLGGLQVVAARKAGDSAVVRVAILSYKPGFKRPASTLPTSMAMKREGGKWLFANTTYLRRLAKAYPGV